VNSSSTASRRICALPSLQEYRHVHCVYRTEELGIIVANPATFVSSVPSHLPPFWVSLLSC
jgi:hypothetical protein